MDIILQTACWIGGVAYEASSSPLKVSEAEAKTLFSLRYAIPAPVVVATPQKGIKPSPGDSK